MVFTVISDQADTIVEELNGNEAFRRYAPLTYTSDHSCMEEAHQHNMSFGKYRTYLELLQYDDEVTIDDCHGMSMGEMHDKIVSCKHEHTTEAITAPAKRSMAAISDMLPLSFSPPVTISRFHSYMR